MEIVPLVVKGDCVETSPVPMPMLVTVPVPAIDHVLSPRKNVVLLGVPVADKFAVPMPVRDAPEPENSVEVVVPLTQRAVDGVAVPIPTFDPL